jgi:endoglucanase
MNKKALLDLLSQPTAPYRESHVVQWIENYLKRQLIPFFKDVSGNLVLGVGNEQEYRLLLSQAEREPIRLFVAHMDHPGFHGVRWKNPLQLEVKWFGGSPRKHLVGSQVWLADSTKTKGTGILQSAVLAPSKTHLAKATIRLKKPLGNQKATSLFGGFGFRAPVWEKSGVLYTKAADDLVGCFAVIETAKKALESKPRKFIGLLTRAEEVGFVGCIAHLEQGWLRDAKRVVLFVSLETSRTLPGAIVGKGPIVRLGDRASIFSQNHLEVLNQIAQKKLSKKYQRRVMDGGTCEATVAVAHQIPAIGISIPLGNYHNQGFEGGPDCKKTEGPAPEFVSLSDIKGMLKLCEGLLEEDLPWEDPWKKKRGQLLEYLEEGRKHL